MSRNQGAKLVLYKGKHNGQLTDPNDGGNFLHFLIPSLTNREKKHVPRKNLID